MEIRTKEERRRYFSALALLVLELDNLSENFLIRGYVLKNLLKKYGVSLAGSKKYPEVEIELPEGVDSSDLTAFNKDLFKQYNDFKWKRRE